MNDKCAAGTGRFLSLMAATLDMDLAHMGEISSRSTEPVTLNSTCAVFAESEVVSLIAQGRKKEDIVAGLHAAIAQRIATMVRQLGGKDVFFSGGGARNSGVRRALESALGHRVHVPPEPQFIVATGAAVIAAAKAGVPH
jgi:predicted CoA-substrate-specific enzyme activase